MSKANTFWVLRWRSAAVALVPVALLAPSVAVAQQKVSASVGKPLKAAQDACRRRTGNGALARSSRRGRGAQTAYDNYKINELLWYVYCAGAHAGRRHASSSSRLPPARCRRREGAAHQDPRAALFPRRQLRQGRAVREPVPEVAPGDQDMQLLIAQAYYQQKDYKNAIAAADRMIKGSAKPGEDVLQLKPAQQLRDRRQDGQVPRRSTLLLSSTRLQTPGRGPSTATSPRRSTTRAAGACIGLSEDVGVLAKPAASTPTCRRHSWVGRLCD